MSAREALFSFYGRIGRLHYFLAGLGALAAAAALIAVGYFAIGDMAAGGMAAFYGAAFLLLVWSGAALMVKRLRDIGMSAWHLVWLYGLQIGAATATNDVMRGLALIVLSVAALWLLTFPGDGIINAAETPSPDERPLPLKETEPPVPPLRDGWKLTRGTYTLIKAGAICAGIYFLAGYLWPAGFSDADIAAVKTSIRDEFKKRHVDIAEVSMLRESPTKLVGFIKMKSVPLLGDVTRSCTATMADNAKNYMWKCD